MSDWIRCSDRLPEDGVVVDTKVDDDEYGCRLERPLKRRGRFWLYPDGSRVYLYRDPTHWRVVREACK